MSRRYPGKPRRMGVRKCLAVTTWVVHVAHPWDSPRGRYWCPGWTGRR